MQGAITTNKYLIPLTTLSLAEIKKNEKVGRVHEFEGESLTGFFSLLDRDDVR